MSKYRLPHHQLVERCLENFNKNFLEENHILFGGGTRISLEINEYRESVDIDFLCQDKHSYRAVREQVTNESLGKLVMKDFTYARDIRTNRDSVITLLDCDGEKIKLEFVCFDNYKLTAGADPDLFPVPYLERTSCFYTKLLANADRALSIPYKDIFDIVAMVWKWGDIPEKALELARSHYGIVVDRKLAVALRHMVSNKSRYKEASIGMSIEPDLFDKYLFPVAEMLLDKLVTGRGSDSIDWT